MTRYRRSARRKLVVVSVFPAMVLAGSGIALADDVVVGPDQTVPAGGSGSFQVYLVAESVQDPINSCNANNPNPVTVSFTTTNSAVVVAPVSRSLTACDDPTTPGVVEGAQTVNFSVASGASVGAETTITARASGGRTTGSSSQGAQIVGTFEPDSITITVGATPTPCAGVTAPSAPVIASVPAVNDGDNGWFTTTPTVSATSAGATVTYSTDNDTWNSTPPTLADGTTTVYARAEKFSGSTSCGVASSQREFNVDTVAPTVTPSDVLETTWLATSRSQDFIAFDSTSDLADTGDAAFTLTASAESSRDSAGNVVPTVDSKTVYDVAGNSTTRQVSAWIDLSGPQVSPGDVNNTTWRGSSLSGAFTAADPLSGLSNPADASFTLTASAESTRDSSGDVVPTVASKTVSDAVGNSTTRSVSAWIDKTGPRVTCPAAPTFIKGSTGSLTARVSDALSGPASATITEAADTGTVGSRQVSITATDNVGNSTTLACSYSVIYPWIGFYQPIDVLNNDASVATVSNVTVWNSAKAGSAIPVKFSLGGDQGLSVLATGSPFTTKVTCPGSTGNVDPIETLAGATSGLKYDPVADQYNYTWKTSSTLAATCQRLEVKLVDGTSHYAFFKFTK